MKRSGTELEARNRRLRRERANAKLDLDPVKKQRRISRDRRGAVLRERYPSRRIQRGPDMPPIEGIAQWRLPVAHPTAESAGASPCSAGCAGGDHYAQCQRRYGRPRILRERGRPVGYERVRKNLQRQKLRPVYRRPYRATTDSNHRKSVAPNVSSRCPGWTIDHINPQDL